ncbi:MAG TPA: glycosyltransferase family 9 protein [Chitinophagaceae bacterium]
MSEWHQCKNILCIRADNMGDVIMATPALRALKETFECRITILTSKMGNAITPFIPEIDEVIACDLPWIKSTESINAATLFNLTDKIKEHRFDGAVIFTVYSQNPLPSAILAFMAGIPKRLAYCRENPYHLLTDWIPEKEPLNYIQHQVQRDLDLVAAIGAKTNNDLLSLTAGETAFQSACTKLPALNEQGNDEWIIFHPGVSEEKRRYPTHMWIELGQIIRKRLKKKIIITGSSSEKKLAETIQNGIGGEAYAAAGLFSIEEFISVIKAAQLVVSVNTSTVHIAAATQTPVIVLYALTNPQHTPWKVSSKVFPFPVNEKLKSRNEIINYVNEHFFNKVVPMPLPENIFYAVAEILYTEVKPKHHHETTGILSL